VATQHPSPASEAAIRVRGLVTEIGGQVLHDKINFDVKYGEVLAIVGGSGGGKLVLLR